MGTTTTTNNPATYCTTHSHSNKQYKWKQYETFVKSTNSKQTITKSNSPIASHATKSGRTSSSSDECFESTTTTAATTNNYPASTVFSNFFNWFWNFSGKCHTTSNFSSIT